MVKNSAMSAAAIAAQGILYSRSMHDYIKHVVWPIVEPATPFIDNWHIHAICEHLEAVLNGEITDLLINMPPRFMKSLLIAVSLPTFSWIDRPETKFIFASYSGQLSTRDAVKARRVIDNKLYRKYYGDRFELTSDQNVKTRYENDKTGYRISTSIGGVGTGEGGDIIVVDDPHNVLEAESDTKRLEAIEWWDETMSTRGNNPETAARIIVMQRVHGNDLSGHTLRKGGYEHLMIPMRFEEKRVCVTCLGRVDPRTEEGELAWPTRFTEKATKKLEQKLGNYGTAGQFQQRPASREGAIFKRAWFKRYTELTKPDMKVQVWDTAQKDNQRSDWTVCGTFFIKDNHAYLQNIRRERLEYPDLKTKAKLWYMADMPNVIVIEDKGHGTALIQELRQAGGYPVEGMEPGDLSKELRAEQEAAMAEGGNLSFPAKEPEWWDLFDEELFDFPAVAHDDQTDVVVMFLKWFRTRIHSPFSGFGSAGPSPITSSGSMSDRMLIPASPFGTF